MTFTPGQKLLLSTKLDSSRVKTRQQAGRALSYVEGWFAIAEANRIFDFDGWHRETVEIKPAHEPYQNEKGNWVAGYVAKVRITVGDIVREGCGFGSGIDRDLGRAVESALKESETDSMKRALMTFGNPFGLALYDKEQNGVEHEKPAAKFRPPMPDGPMQLPPAGTTKGGWQKFGATVLGVAELAQAVDDLVAWQTLNGPVFKAIHKESAALHQWIVDGMTAHYDKLSNKEAA